MNNKGRINKQNQNISKDKQKIIKKEKEIKTTVNKKQPVEIVQNKNTSINSNNYNNMKKFSDTLVFNQKRKNPISNKKITKNPETKEKKKFPFKNLEEVALIIQRNVRKYLKKLKNNPRHQMMEILRQRKINILSNYKVLDNFSNNSDFKGIETGKFGDKKNDDLENVKDEINRIFHEQKKLNKNNNFNYDKDNINENIENEIIESKVEEPKNYLENLDEKYNLDDIDNKNINEKNKFEYQKENKINKKENIYEKILRGMQQNKEKENEEKKEEEKKEEEKKEEEEIKEEIKTSNMKNSSSIKKEIEEYLENDDNENEEEEDKKDTSIFSKELEDKINKEREGKNEKNNIEEILDNVDKEESKIITKEEETIKEENKIINNNNKNEEKKEEVKTEAFKHLTNILDSSTGKNIIKPKLENNKKDYNNNNNNNNNNDNIVINKNNINEKNENIQNQLNLNKYMTGIQAQANNVALNLELKETKKTMETMNSIINDLKQQLQDKDDYYNQQLENQKNENNIILNRQNTLMESLISEKKKMEIQINELQEKLNQNEKISYKKLQSMRENYELETKKNKDAWFQAEKIRRKKWEEQKLKEIKDLTAKSLEPEIEKIIST